MWLLALALALNTAETAFNSGLDDNMYFIECPCCRQFPQCPDVQACMHAIRDNMHASRDSRVPGP